MTHSSGHDTGRGIVEWFGRHRIGRTQEATPQEGVWLALIEYKWRPAARPLPARAHGRAVAAYQFAWMNHAPRMRAVCMFLLAR
ncbi:hypothetical protein PATSB16_02210 [Pandoraea thiooxydans]|nr:hypothetical protein PATSB16_02210 [Pandoraea thiooxydans]